jgi:hypothetical protein
MQREKTMRDKEEEFDRIYHEVHELCVRELVDEKTDVSVLASALLGNVIRGLVSVYGIPKARAYVEYFMRTHFDGPEYNPEPERLPQNH